MPLWPPMCCVLSAAYGRLGQHSAAIDAPPLGRATLDPFSVIGYQQSAAAFLSAQRGDEAAVALMTGVMVTEDRALRDELVDLYRQGLDSPRLRARQHARGRRHQPIVRDGSPPRLRTRPAKPYEST